MNAAQKKRRLSGSPMPEDAPKRLSAASDSSIKHGDASKREAALLLRLSKKEEEVQSLVSELTSLALAHNLDTASLHRKLLDPAVNALFRAMKKELADRDRAVSSIRDELAAVTFTPNSVTGKKLVAKLKALRAENEELGRQLRTGRVEGYEVQLGLGKRVIDEMRSALDESDAFTVSLDIELESLQDRAIELQSQVDRYERMFGPLPPEPQPEIRPRSPEGAPPPPHTPPQEYEEMDNLRDRVEGSRRDSQGSIIVGRRERGRGLSIDSDRRISMDEGRSGEYLDEEGVLRDED